MSNAPAARPRTAKEIRKSFLDFFESKKHRIVASVPVVPQGDPTLMFTNAGMNPFKDIFLGFRKPEHGRVANSQKCIRVSGKHNDLEEVGVDTYHHTFFEMLGNWSFGDYYKKEAISWAWELLTKVWGLPKDKLYATVHTSDDEAVKIWTEVTDLPAERILRFGDKDNFWEMGETGPCGPCTEIHIDLGAHVDPDPKAWVNSGSPRYREIWNLVFIQNNRRPDGGLDELSSKHVDTGMGFERICSILQGKDSNYDSDVFTPILDAISKRSGKAYEAEADRIAMRVIADHLRALSFSIADGVVPSNEGRGYVMRRLLRRALRYGRTLGLTEPFMNELVPVLAAEMGDTYPELRDQLATIRKVLLAEEESFNRMLDRGLALFADLKKKALAEGRKEIAGADAFALYDTFGFPFDLTALLARENGMAVDSRGFDLEMEKQRERSRGKVAGNDFDLNEALKVLSPKTTYLGEETNRGKGKLIALLREGKRLPSIREGEEAVLVFDRSVFYAEGGGQGGDRGVLKGKEGRFRVEDVKKVEGFFLHLGVLEQGVLAEGEECEMEYDLARRTATRRHHSSTHLLQKALRTVLGDHVKQAGSQVGPESLRFDFNHFKALAAEELARVEDLVNAAVLRNHPVDIREMSRAEADKTGAMAFFGEKYGDKVRVVDMGGYSVELCGGSHVKATGEIGAVRIVAETSSASGIRRIEAVAGERAALLAKEEARVLREAMETVQVASPALLTARLRSLLQENKELQKKVQASEARGLSERIAAIPFVSKGIAQFLWAEFEGVEAEALREAVDSLRSQPGRVVFLVSRLADKVVFLAGVSKDLTAKIKAGDLVKKAAELAGGGGGGRPDFAQAGGKDASRLPEIRATLEGLLG